VTDEETELMLRVAAGDVAAFETLVGRVLPRLVGYFRRMGADRALAEDCSQEVLVKVYRVRDRYVPKARFMTYLFHVARNHWIDVYRHAKAGPQTISSDLPTGGEDEGTLGSDLPGAPADPSEGASRSELAKAIHRALEALGTEHREVFVLAQVEGLKYEEIADLVGIPIGTVKSRMHAAVRLVREALRREGIEP
jgi:RNA polymerase sigma-70 factor (ECF subfamily)